MSINIEPLPDSPNGELLHQDVRLKVNEIADKVSNQATGYGGLTRQSSIAIGNINATPQKLPFEAVVIDEPQNVVQDVVNSAISTVAVGLWRLHLGVSFSFDAENASRTIKLELYNETDGVSLGTTSVKTGRDLAGVAAWPMIPIEIPLSAAGRSLVVRAYSEADTFTNVALDSGLFYAELVQYLGPS